MEPIEVVLYTLGSLDLFLFLVTLVQFIFLFLRERMQLKLGVETNSNNGPKLFQFTLMFCLLVRVLFLVIQPSVFEGKINMSPNMESIWSHLDKFCSFWFFSCCFCYG